MTTTLRPTEPLQRDADGTRSRHYQVCVNSRPVGELGLGTHPVYGEGVARIRDLRIDEADRGRGRGTVAALAAEEVARSWGCGRIEVSIPAAKPSVPSPWPPPSATSSATGTWRRSFPPSPPRFRRAARDGA